MKQWKRTTPDQQASILEALSTTAKSARLIAGDFGVDPKTVTAIAEKRGIDLRSRAARIGSDAARDFNTVRQLEVGNRLVEQLDGMIDQGIAGAKELRDAVVSYGVLVDKRRLIDGQSTSNVASQVQVWRRRGPAPVEPPRLE